MLDFLYKTVRGWHRAIWSGVAVKLQWEAEERLAL